MFWNKKQEPQVQPEYSGVKFTLDEHDNIFCNIRFPDFEQMEDEDVFAFTEKFATFCWLVNNGDFLTQMQQAIAEKAVHNPNLKKLCGIILNHMNILLKKHGENPTDVVVCPTKAFDVRNHKEND